MSEHRYTRSQGPLGYDVDVRTLASATEESLPGKPFSISANGDDLVFVFGEDLDQDSIGALDTLVEEHKAVVFLEAAKRLKKDAVDMRTAELVTSGFEHNGRVFSSSEVMQKNISEMHKVRAMLTYPFMVATKDNSEIYAIADADEVDAMYLQALTTIIARYQAGNALKQQIISAGSPDELAAIVDDR